MRIGYSILRKGMAGERSALPRVVAQARARPQELHRSSGVRDSGGFKLAPQCFV